MDSHALMILDSACSRGPYFQEGVKAVRRHRDLFVADHMASLDRSLFLAAQIQRDSLTPRGNLHGLVVDLKAANAEQLVSGKRTNPIGDLDLAAQRGAGDDQPVALQHKDTVYRKAEIAT